MKLRVPYYKQDKIYTCGPASLQMVFKFLGEFESEKTLTKKTGTSPDTGTSHKSMVSVARSKGFVCREIKRASLDDLAESLENGLPVIVNFIEPTDNTSHYAVVTSIERGEVILNDPWNGKDFKIEEKEFVSRWHNKKNTSKRWMLVISPP